MKFIRRVGGEKSDVTMTSMVTGGLAGGIPVHVLLSRNESKYEQVRRHKKNRINKKWAKMYGLRMPMINIGIYGGGEFFIHPDVFNVFSV